MRGRRKGKNGKEGKGRVAVFCPKNLEFDRKILFFFLPDSEGVQPSPPRLIRLC